MDNFSFLFSKSEFMKNNNGIVQSRLLTTFLVSRKKIFTLNLKKKTTNADLESIIAG